MLSSALIIFREVFEIVLIIGIILAATRGMPHRNKAILLGFSGGILGAGLVALFTSSISAMASGMGQELFNAGIMFSAAFFIGCTVLWMRKHGREMKARFKELKEGVTNGSLSFYSLSAVIAATILREGSEIVLFTYGMLISGQSPASMAVGFAIGITGGVIVGVLLYKGLIKLPVGIFMQATSWLLVTIVAGMMAQGVGFLVQAGVFEKFSNVVWDSSNFVSDDSLLGKSLKALVGYTAQPMEIQLIIYAATFIGLFALMKGVSGLKLNFSTRQSA